MLGHYPRALIRGDSDVLSTTHFLGSLNSIALTGVRVYIPCSCLCALNEEANLVRPMPSCFLLFLLVDISITVPVGEQMPVHFISLLCPHQLCSINILNPRGIHTGSSSLIFLSGCIFPLISACLLHFEHPLVDILQCSTCCSQQ